MKINKPAMVVALSVLTTSAFAQLKLPIFDVEMKIHQMLSPGDGNQNFDVEFFETTNLYTGVHVQVNQYLAVGAFYSRSFRGIVQLRYDDGNIKYDGLMMQRGVDLRLSTGRSKKWRQFMTVQYGQIELVQDNDAFRLASKSNLFGVNLGIMRRLGRNLYFNVIELGVKVLPDKFLIPNNDLAIDARMGIIYNIGKKK